MTRRGFALLTVLWITVAASAVALAAALTAREHLDGAQNRIDMERALWRAADCVERERAAVDAALREAKRDMRDAVRAWRQLDRATAIVRLPDCSADLEASGSRMDINRASDAQILALFRAMHLYDAEALADRLLDWRDADDDVRPHGMERDGYASLHRVLPPNGPIGSVSELRRVAGFEGLDGLDSVLAVDQGKLCVNHAPLVALSTVPGFTPEVLDRIAADRVAGVDVADVLALASAASRSAADTMMAHYPEVVSLVTVNPDAWIIVAHGWSGTPRRRATIQVALALEDSTAAVVRWRIP